MQPDLSTLSDSELIEVVNTHLNEHPRAIRARQILAQRAAALDTQRHDQLQAGLASIQSRLNQPADFGKLAASVARMESFCARAALAVTASAAIVAAAALLRLLR